MFLSPSFRVLTSQVVFCLHSNISWQFLLFCLVLFDLVPILTFFVVSLPVYTLLIIPFRRSVLSFSRTLVSISVSRPLSGSPFFINTITFFCVYTDLVSSSFWRSIFTTDLSQVPFLILKCYEQERKTKLPLPTIWIDGQISTHFVNSSRTSFQLCRDHSPFVIRGPFFRGVQVDSINDLLWVLVSLNRCPFFQNERSIWMVIEFRQETINLYHVIGQF